MIGSAAFVIRASDHVVDFAVEPFPPTDPAAALQAAMRGESPASLVVPLIYTGISAGPVNLAVQVLDERPEIIETGWEDIHEVSLTFPEGNAYFNEPTGWDRQDVGTIMAEERAVTADGYTPRDATLLLMLWWNRQSSAT